MKAPMYCYIVSLNGIFININAAALKALGYTKDELVGKPLKTIYAPNSHSKIDMLFAKWKTTGYLQNELVEIIKKNGEKRLVLLSVEAIKGEDGNIMQSISMQVDVTQMIKNEALAFE